MKTIGSLAMVLVLAASGAVADDRETYNRRAAEADLTAFRVLDLNRDGVLTRDEVLADLNFGPRFNDVDINRDGVVTREELRRYLDRTYGVVVTETNQLVMQLSPPSAVPAIRANPTASP
ncbi:MAG: EF-hand domain-containing protein [Burkholderiales bacterium]